MIKDIYFTVPGPPKGKARARTVHRRNGGVFSYTPESTVLYENLVKTSYYQSESSRVKFMDGEPLAAYITACFGIPKSTSRKKRQEMLSGAVLPTKKPDIDNIAKCILDALNGIAYHDDTQVAALCAEKIYAECPEVRVKICTVQAIHAS